jgi:HAD superfamily hydrolase (TIGR01509 family)
VTGSGDGGRLLQAVLVDMDGTLVDTEPYWKRHEVALMHEHGLEWTDADAAEMVGNALLVSARHLHGRGVRMDPEAIVEVMVAGVLSDVRRHVPWLPGARELLAALHDAGVPVALVTMSYRSLAEAVVGELPEGHVDALVTGDEVRRGKPHPEPYVRAAALLGADPARCVAIEDSRTGVASAEAAGCVALAVPHVQSVPAAPGRYVRESLEGVDVDTLEGLVSASSATRSRWPTAR